MKEKESKSRPRLGYLGWLILYSAAALLCGLGRAVWKSQDMANFKKIPVVFPPTLEPSSLID